MWSNLCISWYDTVAIVQYDTCHLAQRCIIRPFQLGATPLLGQTISCQRGHKLLLTYTSAIHVLLR